MIHDEFYRSLGSDYDLMTGFDERLKNQREIIAPLVGGHAFSRAVDAGCGTGALAIALSQLGVEVTGIDSSATVLEQAKLNANRYDQKVDFMEAELGNFRAHISQTFDAVFCLGNTLPHILRAQGLESVLANFGLALTSGGIVILELLNYTRILQSRERMVGLRETDNKTFVRFYDFEDELLRFNILVIAREQKPRYTWHSTPLYPWRWQQLDEIFRKIGFRNVRYYSDLSRSKFDEAVSKNLVVFAQE